MIERGRKIGCGNFLSKAAGMAGLLEIAAFAIMGIRRHILP
jgi:hypothetical protein